MRQTLSRGQGGAVQVLCMCAFVCIVAGSALTAGAVTVFAAEDSTEECAADGEQQGIVEESDSPAKGCTGI